MSFTVAIVGRPNVGKSTLFNRLAGKRLALVHDLPGVTRDWREGGAEVGDLSFRLIDTAGLEEAAPETLAGRMRRQTKAAIGEADAVLFVIDARAGVLPADRLFAQMLRTIGEAGDRWSPTRARAGRATAVISTPTRSASASRSPSRPSMASACPTSMTRSARRCRDGKGGAPRGTRSPRGSREADPHRHHRPAELPASRRWSIV